MRRSRECLINILFLSPEQAIASDDGHTNIKDVTGKEKTVLGRLPGEESEVDMDELSNLLPNSDEGVFGHDGKVHPESSGLCEFQTRHGSADQSNTRPVVQGNDAGINTKINQVARKKGRLRMKKPQQLIVHAIVHATEEGPGLINKAELATPCKISDVQQTFPKKRMPKTNSQEDKCPIPQQKVSPTESLISQLTGASGVADMNRKETKSVYEAGSQLEPQIAVYSWTKVLHEVTENRNMEKCQKGIVQQDKNETNQGSIPVLVPDVSILSQLLQSSLTLKDAQGRPKDEAVDMNRKETESIHEAESQLVPQVAVNLLTSGPHDIQKSKSQEKPEKAIVQESENETNEVGSIQDPVSGTSITPLLLQRGRNRVWKCKRTCLTPKTESVHGAGSQLEHRVAVAALTKSPCEIQKDKSLETPQKAIVQKKENQTNEAGSMHDPVPDTTITPLLPQKGCKRGRSPKSSTLTLSEAQGRQKTEAVDTNRKKKKSVHESGLQFEPSQLQPQGAGSSLTEGPHEIQKNKSLVKPLEAIVQPNENETNKADKAGSVPDQVPDDSITQLLPQRGCKRGRPPKRSSLTLKEAQGRPKSEAVDIKRKESEYVHEAGSQLEPWAAVATESPCEIQMAKSLETPQKAIVRKKENQTNEAGSMHDPVSDTTITPVLPQKGCMRGRAPKSSTLTLKEAQGRPKTKAVDTYRKETDSVHEAESQLNPQKIIVQDNENETNEVGSVHDPVPDTTITPLLPQRGRKREQSRKRSSLTLKEAPGRQKTKAMDTNRKKTKSVHEAGLQFEPSQLQPQGAGSSLTEGPHEIQKNKSLLKPLEAIVQPNENETNKADKAGSVPDQVPAVSITRLLPQRGCKRGRPPKRSSLTLKEAQGRPKSEAVDIKRKESEYVHEAGSQLEPWAAVATESPCEIQMAKSLETPQKAIVRKKENQTNEAGSMHDPVSDTTITRVLPQKGCMRGRAPKSSTLTLKEAQGRPQTKAVDTNRKETDSVHEAESQLNPHKVIMQDNENETNEVGSIQDPVTGTTITPLLPQQGCKRGRSPKSSTLTLNEAQSRPKTKAVDANRKETDSVHEAESQLNPQKIIMQDNENETNKVGSVHDPVSDTTITPLLPQRGRPPKSSSLTVKEAQCRQKTEAVDTNRKKKKSVHESGLQFEPSQLPPQGAGSSLTEGPHEIQKNKSLLKPLEAIVQPNENETNKADKAGSVPDQVPDDSITRLLPQRGCKRGRPPKRSSLTLKEAQGRPKSEAVDIKRKETEYVHEAGSQLEPWAAVATESPCEIQMAKSLETPQKAIVRKKENQTNEAGSMHDPGCDSTITPVLPQKGCMRGRAPKSSTLTLKEAQGRPKTKAVDTYRKETDSVHEAESQLNPQKIIVQDNENETNEVGSVHDPVPDTTITPLLPQRGRKRGRSPKSSTLTLKEAQGRQKTQAVDTNRIKTKSVHEAGLQFEPSQLQPQGAGSSLTEGPHEIQKNKSLLKPLEAIVQPNENETNKADKAGSVPDQVPDVSITQLLPQRGCKRGRPPKRSSLTLKEAQGRPKSEAVDIKRKETEYVHEAGSQLEPCAAVATESPCEIQMAKSLETPQKAIVRKKENQTNEAGSMHDPVSDTTITRVLPQKGCMRGRAPKSSTLTLKEAQGRPQTKAVDTNRKETDSVHEAESQLNPHKVIMQDNENETNEVGSIQDPVPGTTITPLLPQKGCKRGRSPKSSTLTLKEAPGRQKTEAVDTNRIKTKSVHEAGLQFEPSQLQPQGAGSSLTEGPHEIQKNKSLLKPLEAIVQPNENETNKADKAGSVPDQVPDDSITRLLPQRGCKRGRPPKRSSLTLKEAQGRPKSEAVDIKRKETEYVHEAGSLLEPWAAVATESPCEIQMAKSLETPQKAIVQKKENQTNEAGSMHDPVSDTTITRVLPQKGCMRGRAPKSSTLTLKEAQGRPQTKAVDANRKETDSVHEAESQLNPQKIIMQENENGTNEVGSVHDPVSDTTITPLLPQRGRKRGRSPKSSTLTLKEAQGTTKTEAVYGNRKEAKSQLEPGVAITFMTSGSHEIQKNKSQEKPEKAIVQENENETNEVGSIQDPVTGTTITPLLPQKGCKRGRSPKSSTLTLNEAQGRKKTKAVDANRKETDSVHEAESQLNPQKIIVQDNENETNEVGSVHDPVPDTTITPLLPQRGRKREQSRKRSSLTLKEAQGRQKTEAVDRNRKKADSVHEADGLLNSRVAVTSLTKASHEIQKNESLEALQNAIVQESEHQTIEAGSVHDLLTDPSMYIFVNGTPC